MSPKRIVHLTPPKISAEHIKEKVTCIRAHRERIFNTSAEMQQDKLICHNYGQGGAGWTFLFGCVNESLRLFEKKLEACPELRAQPIAVIGAGCYGLLTAIMLKRQGYTVRIIAKDIEQLPSQKAAGFFFPRARKCSTQDEIAVFTARGIESYATYQQIIAGTHPFLHTGARMLPAYYDPTIDPGFAPYIAQKLMQEPEEVVIHFGNGKQYSAHEYMTLFIETTRMMQELWRTEQELAIPLTRQEINSFHEITEPIIFNCAGLGAQKLSGDKRIVPVQGHLITLKDQPPLEELQYMINFKVPQTTLKGYVRDELVYYAPKENGILGITFIRGQDSLTANQHEFDRLLERCQTYFGS